MSDSTAPDTPEALVLEEIEEHIADIMFDSLERPDPDCTLCRKGVDLGVWARYGYEDPFNVEDE